MTPHPPFSFSTISKSMTELDECERIIDYALGDVVVPVQRKRRRCEEVVAKASKPKVVRFHSHTEEFPRHGRNEQATSRPPSSSSWYSPNGMNRFWPDAIETRRTCNDRATESLLSPQVDGTFEIKSQRALLLKKSKTRIEDDCNHPDHPSHLILDDPSPNQKENRPNTTPHVANFIALAQIHRQLNSHDGTGGERSIDQDDDDPFDQDNDHDNDNPEDTALNFQISIEFTRLASELSFYRSFTYFGEASLLDATSTSRTTTHFEST